ncbi:MAG: hypothetical protein KZQ96_17110 [Candidatus Thiodiazotropha sp. (ex Lucinoma borealis)]|nr:hypothetical protein [Candidatus Thiodiazotropha sp. (ex Lucinoma borealis)]MCU7854186.1 hypothetical protein [Candidatus Thiodiazotropha sp. (ex Lucinoma borealis)]MCU7868561.1 hypothetical protein [Candidatus Thiodiazotropha sp. (ex Lucinoma borealis)]
MAALRSEQFAELEQFFAANKELLEDVSNRLLAVDEIHTEQVFEILRRVSPVPT